jgi:GT2 family glycosyltransferase
MNNYNDVIECVNSIKKFNDCSSFQIILIAFNFSDNNLNFIKTNHADIEIIQTAGIKGFSENNNIGIRHARGKYCLILNDDTFFSDDSITKMLNLAISKNEKCIISPIILNTNGTIQFLGRPQFNFFTFILSELKLVKYVKTGKFVNTLFETHNISGACFLIETQLFYKIGLFDEKYFFCPEDIAVSLKLQRIGGKIYVDTNSHVFHNSSTTAKKIHQITIPVSKQGIYVFLNDYYGLFQEKIFRFFVLLISISKFLFWTFNFLNKTRRHIMLEAMSNCIRYSFSNQTPKEVFTELFSLQKNNS